MNREMGSNMSKWIFRALGATAAFACMSLVAGSVLAESKTYNLRYSDIGPPRGPRADALMWWAEELDKRSSGRLKINFFWSQSLVKGKDTIKAVGSGLAETGTIIGIYNPAELPVWELADAPFANDDVWVGMRTWYELRQKVPELAAETDKLNVKILFNNTTGPVQLLTTKKPVLSAADLKGMKIRTAGGWTDLMQDLGAVPVNIGFGELYQALERGTIDGTINYTPFIKSYKHFEVASHVTEANMGQVLGYGGGINQKLFNEMPKDLQDVLVKTSDEYMDVYARKYIEDSDKTKAELIAGIDGRKVEYHQLSAAELAIWEKTALRFTEDWLAKMESKGIDGKKIVALFVETREKYRKQLKDQGYPWGKTN